MILLKISKYLKITAILSTVILSLSGCSSKINNSSNIEKEQKENVSEVNQSNENEIPYILPEGEYETESGTDMEARKVDNEEITKKYELLNKSNLTYELADIENNKSYFYEADNGFVVKNKVNDNMKPINDKKYGQILLGYSYCDLQEGVDKEFILDKVSKVLPNDIKENYNKKFTNYEIINYSSQEDNFVVFMYYDRSCENKDIYEFISYFKEIE